MIRPNPEKVSKLPSWAQDYIKNLEREHALAVKELKDSLDHQSPSKFYAPDILCISEEGEKGTQYIRKFLQVNTVHCVNAGVEVSILPREDRIDLSFSIDEQSRGSPTDVALSPNAANSISIYSVQRKK